MKRHQSNARVVETVVPLQRAAVIPLYQADPVRCVDEEGCWWPKVRHEQNRSGTCCELDHVCWLVERERIARRKGVHSRP